MPAPNKPIRNQLVVREFKRNLPVKAIAKRHEISCNRVYFILHRAGITVQEQKGKA